MKANGTGLIGRDAMLLESPAAQAELTVLRSLKIGEVRAGKLFPALAADITWTLTSATTDAWEFTGLFFGQPFYRLVIRVDGAKLTLDVWEGV